MGSHEPRLVQPDREGLSPDERDSRDESEAPNAAELREQALALRLHGLLVRRSEVMADVQAAQRVAQLTALGGPGARPTQPGAPATRSGHWELKPVADYAWSSSTQIDRSATKGLRTLQLLADATNILFVKPNGETMCASNLGYKAMLGCSQSRSLAA